MNNFADIPDARLSVFSGMAHDTVTLDSSAAWGNLADAMKNGTVIIPADYFPLTVVILPSDMEESQTRPIPEPPAKWHDVTQ